MSGSFLLTKEKVVLAWKLVKPTITALLDNGLIEHSNVHIVVLDPTMPYAPGVSFQDVVLHQFSYGIYEVIYEEVARSKAEISWRTGYPSHQVQQMYPYLWKEEDTIWGGSAVQYGLIVACSGLPWEFDWTISNMMIAMIQGLSLNDMRKIVEHTDNTYLRR